MVIDEKGNIYYSAECINGIKAKEQEEIERLREENDIALEKLKKATKEIEELQKKIDKALHKLRTSKGHFKTESENNAVVFTIRILEGNDENVKIKR